MHINYPKLIVSIILPLFAGALGSFFTLGAVENWYSVLEKPALNPPPYLFGPVWTFLYILMGVALYIVWIKDDRYETRKKAIIFFIFQLILNAIWSIIFFGLRNPGLAFLDIIILWMAIILTIFNFQKVSKTAAYLLLPYILWVSFASYLNVMILLLN